MKTALRAFLLTITGESAVILMSWIPRRQVADSHSLLVAVMWASLFAFGIGFIASLNLINRSAAMRSHLVSVVASVAMAILGYATAFVVTLGMIAGAKFPLLLIFLGGATFAFVSIFWKGGITSGAISLGVILLVGLGLSAVPYLTMRRTTMIITVVKYVPDNTTQLRIASSPGFAFSEFERFTLAGMNLHGTMEVNRIFSLGPGSPNPSHMTIILTHPLPADVELSEPETNVIYFQDNNEWKEFPSNSKLTFRKVEIYPTSGNCTAIGVWNSLGQQSGTGGPCWRMAQP